MRSPALGLMLLLGACMLPPQGLRQSAVRQVDQGPLDVYRTLRVEPGRHTDAVTALAVDGGGRLLLSGSADKTARLWTLADGTPRAVLRPPIGAADRGRIDAVALSADGRLAAVGGISAGPRPDAVLLFDTGTSRLVSRLEPPRLRPFAGVDRVAFAGSGNWLAVRYAPDASTVLFDARTGAALDRSANPAALFGGGAPNRLVLNDGRRIDGDDIGRIVVTDAGGREVWATAPAALAISRLELSDDGSVVRITGPERTVVFSVADMEPNAKWTPGSRAVDAGAPIPLPDGSVVHAAGGTLVRSTANGKLLWADMLDSRVRALAASTNGTVLVAALGDGTLRWLDGATGRERLAVYLSPGGGWVAWTPDGFFDHSDTAWNLAGWHVNHGPAQAAEFVKLGQLYDVAYRPDLIREAYAGRSETAAAIAAGDATDPAGRLASGLPPRVGISVEPTSDRRRVTVQAEVQERGGGIGKVLYRVNGVVVAIDREQTPPRSAASLHLIRTLPLRDGPNQIEVDALDAANELESAPATGTVAEGRAESRQGQLWVVVVGINDYADPSMRLKYAKPDAEAIAAALSRSAAANFTAVHVVPLFDSSARTAALGRAIRALSDSMAESDTFVLYLSGHGFNLRGRYEFITYDVTAPTFAQIAEHSLSQGQLQDLLAGVPAARAVVVLDTCYAGGATALSDHNMLIRDADRRVARATGRSVLAAATSSQEALEGYHDHGVLTYVLLEGLAGRAASENQAVTIRELGDYVVRQVPVIASRAFRAKQLPVFTLVGQDIVLTRAPTAGE